MKIGNRGVFCTGVSKTIIINQNINQWVCNLKIQKHLNWRLTTLTIYCKILAEYFTKLYNCRPLKDRWISTNPKFQNLIQNHLIRPKFKIKYSKITRKQQSGRWRLYSCRVLDTKTIGPITKISYKHLGNQMSTHRLNLCPLTNSLYKKGIKIDPNNYRGISFSTSDIQMSTTGNTMVQVIPCTGSEKYWNTSMYCISNALM